MIQQGRPGTRDPGAAVPPVRQSGEERVPRSFTRRAGVAIGLAVLIAALMLILWYTIHVILLAFAAVLFAIFLRALSDGVKYVTRLPNGWSLTVVLVLLVGITAGSLMLLAPRADFYTESHPTAQDVLLLIEVADTSLLLDRRVKMPLYARAGIREAWLCDLTTGRVDVHRDVTAGRYASVRSLTATQQLTATAVPDISVTVAELLG
jgi:hypothetical protein